MILSVFIFVLNVLCAALVQCKHEAEVPHLYNDTNIQFLHKFLASHINTMSLREDLNKPIAFTKVGPVEGFVMQIGRNRKIYSFTGIPYAEPPQSFRDPKPKRPWRGIWQAKSPSPFCPQPILNVKGSVNGQEDCLYLDVHTPRLLVRRGRDVAKQPGLPVIVLLPAGTNLFGGAEGNGPAYMLRENVVFVPLNVRLGIFGYLSTGDVASPGNYALKDQSLAIKWVYENIEAFGGDPEKIIVGGVSSGAYNSQMMLYTKHETKKYVKGILAISGSALANNGLDAVGRVRNASNLVAESVGCPTSDHGRSKEMVDCLRKVDANFLSFRQLITFARMPLLSRMLGPTLESDLPNAFITELPEIQYEREIVPPIPVIFSRTQNELGIYLHANRYTYLPLLRRNWYRWMPEFLQFGFRSARGRKVSDDERQRSLLKVNRFYFKKDSPPRFEMENDFKQFADVVNDNWINVPMWKNVELHHKIAPTYVYLQKHNALSVIRGLNFLQRYPLDFGSPHGSDVMLIGNNTILFSPLSKYPDFDIASRNLLNMIVNFASYGKPLYRTSTGKHENPASSRSGIGS